jgi:multimeric flavodoxin WrbA
VKVLCLLGSPRRKGNSATLADQFLTTAQQCGATTETIFLNSLNSRGCQACYACKTRSDVCVIQDDLAPVLAAVHQADLLVLATPVYYGDITAQLKGFIDRTYSYLTPDYLTTAHPCRLPAGKKLLMIQTQGHPDPALFGDIFPRYETFLKWYGFSDIRLLRACGVGAGGATTVTPDQLAEVKNLATDMVKE